MTTTICIDANFVILLLSLQGTESVYENHWNQWQEDNYELVAPILFGYEVANAFHRAAKAGQITAKEAQSLLESSLSLGINFYSDDELHIQALKIAQRLNLSASYDAHYLALAERLEIEFWTADQRLFNSVQSSLPWVNLITLESTMLNVEK